MRKHIKGYMEAQAKVGRWTRRWYAKSHKFGFCDFCATVVQNVSERIIIPNMLLKSMAERIGTELERIGTYRELNEFSEKEGRMYRTLI